MGRRKFSAEERERIAAAEAEAMEAAHQESVRIRQEALRRALASIDRAWQKSDRP